jgi:hypothetical protein
MFLDLPMKRLAHDAAHTRGVWDDRFGFDPGHEPKRRMAQVCSCQALQA